MAVIASEVASREPVVPVPVAGQPSARPVVLALNAAAIVVAALYFGRTLLVPLALASLLAFVLAPACARLERARLPRVAAVLVTAALTFGLIAGIGLVVGRQVAQLAESLPGYESTMVAKWTALTSGQGVVARALGELPGSLRSGGGQGGGLDAVSVARSVATPLLGPAATVGIVLVFTVFILLSSEDLRDRLVRLMGRRDLHRTILAMNDAARRLQRYFLFQLALNSGLGVVVCLALWVTGLPNPVLWGILAGLMRFVPFIGVFIAVLPPLLLALAVSPGWGLAVAVAGVFVVCELSMGQIVEPLIYGHSTGLSPIAVIVATAFWAFLWGPVGLLLATPITVCLVVVGRHVEKLAFFDIVLGDSSPLEPAETFYQRALEGKGEAMTANARQMIAATSLLEYYDTVALQGLVLAQGDMSRDALSFERQEAIHGLIERLLVQLDPKGAAQMDPDWGTPGSVLCIPGRGQLDDLAAAMATQVLRQAGMGAAVAPNALLGSAPLTQAEVSRVRLCCLSVMELGSGVDGVRYFIRRMQKKLPDARVVICLWHAERDSEMLLALRSGGREEHLVLSIGELLALAQAVSARRAAA